jgi:predicted metalloprotease with PDZ domain
MAWNLIKRLIPTHDSQEVTELESWVVTWEVKSGWSGITDKYHKVFINKSDAITFDTTLNQSAKFINAWISTSIKKN